MDLGRPWVLRGLVIALAVVVGVVAYVATSGGDDDREPASAPEAGEARILSAAQLAEIASSAETPIYWAGEINDTRLELTEEEGSFLVRYLEEDDEAGAAPGQRIAVGSYPLPNPLKALNTVAGAPGARATDVEGIGTVVIDPEAQKNVYLVDPDNEVQVEVYAPTAARAIGLVRSGKVRPVG